MKLTALAVAALAVYLVMYAVAVDRVHAEMEVYDG